MNDASRGRVAWLLTLARQTPEHRDKWQEYAAQQMVKAFMEGKVG